MKYPGTEWETLEDGDGVSQDAACCIIPNLPQRYKDSIQSKERRHIAVSQLGFPISSLKCSTKIWVSKKNFHTRYFSFWGYKILIRCQKWCQTACKKFICRNFMQTWIYNTSDVKTNEYGKCDKHEWNSITRNVTLQFQQCASLFLTVYSLSKF